MYCMQILFSTQVIPTNDKKQVTIRGVLHMENRAITRYPAMNERVYYPLNNLSVCYLYL